MVNYKRIDPEYKNLKYKKILNFLKKMDTTKSDIALYKNNKILESGTSNLLFVKNNETLYIIKNNERIYFNKRIMKNPPPIDIKSSSSSILFKSKVSILPSFSLPIKIITTCVCFLFVVQVLF